MHKRHELEEADSCLNRAADDEPLFVLRANDPLFGEIVRAWAAKYCKRKVKARAYREREAVKHLEALAIAQEGEDWRARAKPSADQKPQPSLRELLARWRERLRIEEQRRKAESVNGSGHE